MDSTLNALHLIVNASVVVQLIMAILAALSLLSWYAIFSKSTALRRAQAKSDGFEREFLSAQNIGHLFQGSLNNRAQAGSLERIFIAGMQGFEQASGKTECALEFAQRSMKSPFSAKSMVWKRNCPSSLQSARFHRISACWARCGAS